MLIYQEVLAEGKEHSTSSFATGDMFLAKPGAYAFGHSHLMPSA